MSSFTVMKPFILASNEPTASFPKNLTAFLPNPKNTWTNRNSILPFVWQLKCKSLSSWKCKENVCTAALSSKEIPDEEEFIVVNFYRFVFIKDPEEEVTKHLSFMEVIVYSYSVILSYLVCKCSLSLY